MITMFTSCACTGYGFVGRTDDCLIRIVFFLLQTWVTLGCSKQCWLCPEQRDNSEAFLLIAALRRFKPPLPELSPPCSAEAKGGLA